MSVTRALLLVDFIDNISSCSATEIHILSAPSGQTCQSYMSQYISRAGGYLLNPTASTNCQFCSRDSTDTFLLVFGPCGISMDVTDAPSQRWVQHVVRQPLARRRADVRLHCESCILVAVILF